MADVAYDLPSPTDTPYNRTPSSSRSRQSRRYESMSPSSSPPPLPSDERYTKRRSNGSINDATDESISPLDPRRFTPTLHASLVSEILSLRRDLEGKTKDIDQLENSLHTAQAENDALGGSLAATSKETRSLKRQMQLLEGGTLNALNEIAQERDNAQNELADLRKRFEQVSKKAKSHEENVDRTQTQWNKDKEDWTAERRALETKVHIVEGRLKVVLSEVANVHMVNGTLHAIDLPTDFREANTGSPVRRNGSPMRRSTASALSHRRQSTTSNSSDHLGGRMSALGTVNGFSNSLADELAFDEEEEAHAFPEDDGRASPDALPEEFERPMSSLSTKARKVLGLPFDLEDSKHPEAAPPSPRKSTIFSSGTKLGSVRESVITHKYVDSAAQYSPPPSPKILPATEEPDTALLVHPSSSVETRNSTEWGPNSPISPVSSIHSRDIPWVDMQKLQKPAMATASCQTIENWPEPQPSLISHEALATTAEQAMPKHDSSPTITQAEAPKPAEMATTGTQTELSEVEEATVAKENLHDAIRRLSIPTIAIIPPASRPATPETNVVLPPRTKNASCQVNMQSNYDSSGVQTDEIRLESAFAYQPPTSSTAYRMPAGKAAPPNSSRRRFQPTPPPAIPASSLSRKDLKPNADEEAIYPPNNDTGPLVRDFASNMTRPVRSSSLFAGFDDDLDQFDEDEFEQEDIFSSQSTARYVLKSGKLVQQEPVLEDIGESSAAEAAGESVAMERLRRSEDGLPPDLKNALQQSRRTSPKRIYVKRVGSSKQPPNYRRAVLISSGAAAHLGTQSPTGSVESVKPPPFPVPVRFSSAKVGKSFSEGGRSSRASSAASPTRKEKSRSKKPILRKARSGPAISPGPNGRRARSRSPPLVDTRVSIVPDMPSFHLPMPSSRPSMSSVHHPSSEASAPRPSVATGPNRKTSHMKSNSDAVSLQQTSVVDSIAQTMVGEWMYKYVRRRKSFGISESKANDWDPNKSVDELSANVTSTGVRHKRWVWLAPYERAVMWSSKQPTSGSALLGKSGRKLTVQSVLDVKDDNPMPKNSITGLHFNRSILILTPERALKFTAITQERHYIWLTALSFLSHSPLSLGDLQALPPPPQGEQYETPPAQFAGSLRRRPIRDSIRIAKGSGRSGMRSFTADSALPPMPSTRPDSSEFYDPTSDAALPPTIPRFSAHTRKRSNTAPRAPPSSFRGFGGRDVPPKIPLPPGSTYSNMSSAAATSDRGVYTPSLGFSSRRGSEASAMSTRQAATGAYYDNTGFNGSTTNTSNQGPNTTGTMRMDAFIQGKPPQRMPNVAPRRQHTGKGKDLSYWGMGEGSNSNRDSMSPIDANMPAFNASRSTSATSYRQEDPFRGF